MQPESMAIGIIGPGAIGCWFTACMAEAGLNVCLVDHDPVRAGHLSRNGIHIETLEGRHRVVNVPVRHGPEALSDLCTIFLCVKSYRTGQALAMYRPPLTHGFCLVSVQNGLGNAEQVMTAWPEVPILCAATSQGALQLEPGSVRHTGNGITQVAAFLPAGLPFQAAVINLLRTGGLPAEPAPDVRIMLWAKLVVNAGLNAVGALWELPNGQILDHPVAGTVARQAAAETMAVAMALGIRLPFLDPVKAMQAVANQTADNHSSMWQDRAAGRQTEIDAINGVVVHEADRHGIPTPANRELVRRICSP